MSPREPFGLGDSRAGGYADVSSGVPPTGPDKDAGPAFVSPKKLSRPSNCQASKLPRFAYFPFGGGRRQCIGAGFAMTEACLVLAAVTQRFRLKLVPGQSVEPYASITLRPKEGIQMTLAERSRGG